MSRTIRSQLVPGTGSAPRWGGQRGSNAADASHRKKVENYLHHGGHGGVVWRGFRSTSRPSSSVGCSLVIRSLVAKNDGKHCSPSCPGFCESRAGWAVLAWGLSCSG